MAYGLRQQVPELRALMGRGNKPVTNIGRNQVVLDEEVRPDAQEDGKTGSPER